MRAVEMELPYTNQREDPNFVVEIDPAAKGATLKGELYWMMDNATEEEWHIILQGWAILNYLDAGTLGECLRTSIIWCRG
jgi:hypothetical protein